MSVRTVGLCVVAAGLLAGCGMFGGSSQNDSAGAQAGNDGHSFLYHIGDPLFSSAKTDATPSAVASAATGVGVNGFLWHASLDTISFMPIASADPFGGVIITDWYSPSESPNERFKLNIFILGRELRADGVRAALFRQKRDAGGQWADASVDGKAGTDIENAILARARQFRQAAVTK